MPLQDPLSYESVVVLIQETLQKSVTLSYVPDNAIVIVSNRDKSVVPAFTDYLIKLYPPDSGIMNKTPKIGGYFHTEYSVVIELWLKSGSKLSSRLLSGNLNALKGIWDFYKDVEGILEHNTFGNILQPMAGNSIRQPNTLSTGEQLLEGIGFIWVGLQFNLR